MEKIRLKKIVHKDNKVSIIALITFVMLSFYLISGHFHLGEPRYLPISDFEMNIPFLIESIWIYVLMYPFIFWSVFSYQDEENFNQILYSFSLIAVISLITFQLFPVGYPREFYPLPHAYSASVNLFYKIRWIDSPMNCFPSLHVSLCFLFTFGHYQENKKLFWVSLIITLLISLSTLTTKQHYIADVIAGCLLAIGSYSLVKKITQIA
jgi:membrane-associated phospholipid phosphatase